MLFSRVHILCTLSSINTSVITYQKKKTFDFVLNLNKLL